MISLKHVVKRYGRIQYGLNDVTFQIYPGEFVFLTGPSGAGKTTLLRLLFREETATSGEIRVAGHRLGQMPRKEIPTLRRKLGVVFQDFKLIQDMTVFENVAFVLKIHGAGFHEQRQRSLRALKMVGLQHKISSFPRQISGGEQQRVSIARALVNDPLVLLADEPTGNLDPELSQEIMSLFERINRQGTTVFIATHDRGLLGQMKKRIIGLENGTLATDEPAPSGASLQASSPIL
uniref:Cell division ATP-binding protein FtsE n=1 Tax=uncultured bacterium contig00163 TaxID=1181594 RepID=A0A806KHT5_9BACT|nr:putative ABC transporter ATP-binding component [uncultured bacterium contig00163]